MLSKSFFLHMNGWRLFMSALPAQRVYEFEHHRSRGPGYGNQGGGNGGGYNKWTIILLIALLMIFMNIPGRVYHSYKVYQDKKVQTYLDQTVAYTIFQKEQLSPVLSNYEQITQSDIQRLILEKRDYKKSFEDLAHPKKFTGYHGELQNLVQNVEDLLLDSTDLISVRNQKPGLYERYNQRITENNAINTKLSEHLIQGLETSKMEYTVHPDGCIEYYIHLRDELDLRLNEDKNQEMIERSQRDMFE